MDNKGLGGAGAQSEQCPKRWENHTACELPHGHVGAHINLKSGFTWFGQVMLDHVPGSVAEKHSRFESTVKPIRPDWADETNTLISAALGDYVPPPPTQRPPAAVDEPKETVSLGDLAKNVGDLLRPNPAMKQVAQTGPSAAAGTPKSSKAPDKHSPPNLTSNQKAAFLVGQSLWFAGCAHLFWFAHSLGSGWLMIPIWLIGAVMLAGKTL